MRKKVQKKVPVMLKTDTRDSLTKSKKPLNMTYDEYISHLDETYVVVKR